MHQRRSLCIHFDFGLFSKGKGGVGWVDGDEGFATYDVDGQMLCKV